MAERDVQRRFNAREREVDRGIKAYWAKLKCKVRVRPSRQGAARKSSPLRLRNGKLLGFIALPRYSGIILDRQGRRGVYMAVEYFGARRTRAGAARQWVVYITRDDGVERDGSGEAVIMSNVGDTAEEQAMAFELIEVINRAARGNGKLFFSMIINLPHDIPVEARREIVERFCEEAFGAYDLPYCAALHEPSAEGDQRNKHAHVLFALRPLRRTGDHEWQAGKELLTEHDNPERFFELRKKFAEIMTSVVRESGKRGRAYTHLSNASRGLKNEPQTHLGAVRTAIVRRGEEVRANVRNLFRKVQGERDMRADRAKLERQDRATRLAAKLRLLALSPLPFLAPRQSQDTRRTRPLPDVSLSRNPAVHRKLPTTVLPPPDTQRRDELPTTRAPSSSTITPSLPMSVHGGPTYLMPPALPLPPLHWDERETATNFVMPSVELSSGSRKAWPPPLPTTKSLIAPLTHAHDLMLVWERLRLLVEQTRSRPQPQRGFLPPDQGQSM